MSGITPYNPTHILQPNDSPGEASFWDYEECPLPSRLSHLEGATRQAVPRRSAFDFSPHIPFQPQAFFSTPRIEMAASRALESSPNSDPGFVARSTSGVAPCEGSGEDAVKPTPRPPQLEGFEGSDKEGEDIPTFTEEAAALALAQASTLMAMLRAQGKPYEDIKHDLHGGVSLEQQLARLVKVADTKATSKFCFKFWC